MLSVLTLNLASAQLPGDFYTIDASHSILEFKIRHIGFGAVRGSFNNYTGMIYFDRDNILATSASVIIEAASVDTRSGRDDNLRKEFFQVDKYPYLKFLSTSVVQREGQYYLLGDLTIGAVTKAVEIPFELQTGPVKDQFKHYRIVFTGALTIDRKAYGIYYRSNSFWDGIIEDSVAIELEIGAKVYNSLETVFPFRENAIGRICMEAYQAEGRVAALKKGKEAMDDPDNHRISHRAMLRGAMHLAQSGDLEGAVELVDVGMELFDRQFEAGERAAFWSAKAKYLAQLGRGEESKKWAKEALIENAEDVLALELMKR